MHEALFDSFVEIAVALTKQYVVGDPLEKTTTLGPMVRGDAANFVRDWKTGVDPIQMLYDGHTYIDKAAEKLKLILYSLNSAERLVLDVNLVVRSVGRQYGVSL